MLIASIPLNVGWWISNGNIDINKQNKRTFRQLPMQSVSITTKVESSNPIYGEVYPLNVGWFGWFMVFNTTFNNISAIS
jgi:hypothetical protein